MSDDQERTHILKMELKEWAQKAQKISERWTRCREPRIAMTVQGEFTYSGKNEVVIWLFYLVRLQFVIVCSLFLSSKFLRKHMKLTMDKKQNWDNDILSLFVFFKIFCFFYTSFSPAENFTVQYCKNPRLALNIGE